MPVKNWHRCRAFSHSSMAGQTNGIDGKNQMEIVIFQRHPHLCCCLLSIFSVKPAGMESALVDGSTGVSIQKFNAKIYSNCWSKPISEWHNRRRTCAKMIPHRETAVNHDESYSKNERLIVAKAKAKEMDSAKNERIFYFFFFFRRKTTSSPLNRWNEWRREATVQCGKIHRKIQRGFTSGISVCACWRC